MRGDATLSEHPKNGRCNVLPAELLSAWVDGEAGAEAEKAAAHVASCPDCGGRASELRRLKSRMQGYAASTRAAAPAGLVETALKGAAGSKPIPRRAPGWRPALQVAAVLLICVVAFAALWPIVRLRPTVPVQALLASPPQMVAPGTDSLVTANPDRAAEWLRARMDHEVPPVNLSLVKADQIGARWYPNEKSGELLYRDAAGRLVSLHIYPGRRTGRGEFRAVRYQGWEYHLASAGVTGVSVAVWEGSGVAYAAVGQMEPDDLLPSAHEMARRCR
jgi:anti-sigma factor RsiW